MTIKQEMLSAQMAAESQKLVPTVMDSVDTGTTYPVPQVTSVSLSRISVMGILSVVMFQISNIVILRVTSVTMTIGGLNAQEL